METMMEKCLDITGYLEACGVSSVDELSDEQILVWARSGKMGMKTKLSVDIVEYGLFGEKPDTEKAMNLLRQAIKEQKEFTCAYIEYESSEGPLGEDEINRESFMMSIK